MANRTLSERRWFPSHQPQTLQIAVGLLYWNAALGLIFGLVAGGLGRLSLILVLAEILGGFGVANERKWGYRLAVVAAFLPLLLLVLGYWSGILTLLFEIALVLLLVHPRSRSYYKTWFR